MQQTPEVTIISFVSGKGGSGKTTTALGMAKLLADVGLKVLVVDLDMATHGATYFFSPQLTARSNDWSFETLINAKGSVRDIDDWNAGAIATTDGFDFIPSSRRLGGTDARGREEGESLDGSRVREALRSILAVANPRYDIILLDNQAGYNVISAKATASANKAVVVSEADPISSDAIDDLISRLGPDLPTFRRYLINKLELSEVGDYRRAVDLFGQMNRLPPIPFDFSVRTAFGNRVIPVDLERPTAFLLALFKTIQGILPEFKELLRHYEESRIVFMFEEYQDKLDSVLGERRETQAELAAIGARAGLRKVQSTRFTYQIVAMTLGAIASFLSIDIAFDLVGSPFLFSLSFVVMLPFVIALGFFILRRLRSLGVEAEEDLHFESRRGELEQIISDQEKEIGIYRNLVAARSAELLVDIELTDELSELRP